MINAYLIGALIWGAVVTAYAIVAASEGGKQVPSMAEGLGSLGMGVVHGLAWPMSIPFTIGVFAWRWLRGDR